MFAGVAHSAGSLHALLAGLVATIGGYPFLPAFSRSATTARSTFRGGLSTALPRARRGGAQGEHKIPARLPGCPHPPTSRIVLSRPGFAPRDRELPRALSAIRGRRPEIEALYARVSPFPRRKRVTVLSPQSAFSVSHRLPWSR